MQKSAIHNGLFLGGALVISSLAFYMTNPKLFLQGKLGLLFMIFFIILYKSGRDARSSLGGEITWSEVKKKKFKANITLR